MESTDKKKVYPTRLAVLAIVLALFVVTIWIIFGWLINDSSIVDRFGAVDALFAGLAFVGLIFAILLQSEELSLQRNELELTRIELQGQKDQLEQQNRTLSKQNLENTFFQLLKFHTDILAAIDLIDTGTRQVKARGRDCFSEFYQRQLRNDYHQIGNEFGSLPEPEKAERAYKRFFARNQADVGHYFRNLYHIFKFIKSLPVDDKQFYANLVVAQLSSYELALLFYNAISEYGKDRFKPLIEEFGVFENLDKSLIIHPSHLDCFSKEAFGNQ